MRGPRFVLLALAAAVTASGGVYKWVDDKGVTHYSDAPPAAQRARELPEVPAPAAAPPASPAAQRWEEQAQALQKERLKREAAYEAGRKAEDARRQEEAVRKARCEQAQQDLYLLATGRRIYTIDDRGERVFVEDKDRPAMMQRKRQLIDESCTAR